MIQIKYNCDMSINYELTIWDPKQRIIYVDYYTLVKHNYSGWTGETINGRRYICINGKKKTYTFVHTGPIVRGGPQGTYISNETDIKVIHT